MIFPLGNSSASWCTDACSKLICRNRANLSATFWFGKRVMAVLDFLLKCGLCSRKNTHCYGWLYISGELMTVRATRRAIASRHQSAAHRRTRFASKKRCVASDFMRRNPAFDRYRESYPRRSELHQNCYSRAGDEQSAAPAGV